MEIYVSPTGLDSNTGSIELPLKTVACAARLAVACSNAGEAVTVWIAAGTYAESIFINDSPASETAPIVFEAIEKGAVIITGADKCIEGWSESDIPGVWRHSWEEAWGLGADVWAEYAESCPHAAMAAIVRRREMLFVNQVACRQVLSVEDLQPGTFLIDEDQSQILLQPEPGVILEQSDIEIGKRGSLFYIYGRSNITLRGLTFCKACNYIPDGTVQATRAAKINIENCSVHSNNGDGICLYECHDVTLNNVTSSNNGFSGIIFYKVVNANLRGVTTNQNNWRGISGGFDYWSTAGMKAMHVHHLAIVDHTAVENATFGLWLDTDISNVLIQNLLSSANRRAGLLLEAGQGPVSVSCSSISQNERGVYIASCANVTLDSCTIHGNRLQQIAVKGDFTNGRTILDWETGLECVGRAEHCQVNSCHVAATDFSQALYGLGDDRDDWESFAAFVNTLEADHNTYCHPDIEHAFVSGSGENIDFPRWQRVTGQDKQSQCLEQDKACSSTPK